MFKEINIRRGLEGHHPCGGPGLGRWGTRKGIPLRSGYFLFESALVEEPANQATSWTIFLRLLGEVRGVGQKWAKIYFCRALAYGTLLTL